MKIITTLFMLVLLAACASPSIDQNAYANASVACVTGATWNGSPASPALRLLSTPADRRCRPCGS